MPGSRRGPEERAPGRPGHGDLLVGRTSSADDVKPGQVPARERSPQRLMPVWVLLRVNAELVTHRPRSRRRPSADQSPRGGATCFRGGACISRSRPTPPQRAACGFLERRAGRLLSFCESAISSRPLCDGLAIGDERGSAPSVAGDPQRRRRGNRGQRRRHRYGTFPDGSSGLRTVTTMLRLAQLGRQPGSRLAAESRAKRKRGCRARAVGCRRRLLAVVSSTSGGR
jgi:hypothetical protein